MGLMALTLLRGLATAVFLLLLPMSLIKVPYIISDTRGIRPYNIINLQGIRKHEVRVQRLLWATDDDGLDRRLDSGPCNVFYSLNLGLDVLGKTVRREVC